MFRSKRRVARHAGFTLVELLVVLAILGMLAALVGPQVLNQLGGAKSKSAAIQIRDFDFQPFFRPAFWTPKSDFLEPSGTAQILPEGQNLPRSFKKREFSVEFARFSRYSWGEAFQGRFWHEKSMKNGVWKQGPKKIAKMCEN